MVSTAKGLRFYVGLSENPTERIKQHNAGKTKSTKGYVPWELFQFEKFANRRLAREREKYLKTGAAKAALKLKWSRSSAG